eukprot:1157614-Pelagomonas_calceolata.AAC.8
MAAEEAAYMENQGIRKHRSWLQKKLSIWRIKGPESIDHGCRRSYLYGESRDGQVNIPGVQTHPAAIAFGLPSAVNPPCLGRGPSAQAKSLARPQSPPEKKRNNNRGSQITASERCTYPYVMPSFKVQLKGDPEAKKA